MSEFSIFITKEATQSRTWIAFGPHIRLPESLLWGPGALTQIESGCVASESWPADHQLLNAVIVDKDRHQISIAGASQFFTIPYHSTLLTRLLKEAWPAYSIEHISLSGDAIASAAEIALPPIDSGLSRKLAAEIFGEQEESDMEVDARRHERRMLEASRELDDQDWWISLRRENETRFAHYEADYVFKALMESGSEFIDQLTEVPESDPPEEVECTRGIVLDAHTKSLSFWAYPRGKPTWAEFNQGWSDWKIDAWLTDGYRRQLDLTGELEQSVPATDLSHLSQFIPLVVEQFDIENLVGSFQSGVRGIVRKGFGCLAVVLAIPAALVWAISGIWKGPFAVAAVFWVIGYIGYQIMASKIKKQLEPIVQQQSKIQNLNPKIGPKEKADRIAHLDRCLKSAGLPSYQQIIDYDDEDDEHIGPIVDIEEYE